MKTTFVAPLVALAALFSAFGAAFASPSDTNINNSASIATDANVTFANPADNVCIETTSSVDNSPQSVDAEPLQDAEHICNMNPRYPGGEVCGVLCDDACVACKDNQSRKDTCIERCREDKRSAKCNERQAIENLN